MLTKSDLEQIKNYLALYGKKDSQLPLASIPLNVEDKVAILQNGVNKLVTISELAQTLEGEVTYDICTVTDYENLSKKVLGKLYICTYDDTHLLPSGVTGNPEDYVKQVYLDNKAFLHEDTKFIYDEEQKKYQKEINQEVQNTLNSLSENKADKSNTYTKEEVNTNINNAVAPKANSADVYTRDETYTKTQVNNLVTTPEQQYVSVETYEELPATGEADTIYRVGGTTSYSEYAWDGNDYIQLSEKNYGIDSEPTVGSENLVKSGGITNMYGSYIENLEFVRIEIDADNRVLEGTKPDGTKVIGGNLEVGGTINGVNLENKVDKEEGKSLINSEFAASQSVVDNSEFMKIETDLENRILSARRLNGIKVENAGLEVKEILNIDGVKYFLSQSNEWIDVLVDAKGRIIAGIKVDGSVYINNIEGVTDTLKEFGRILEDLIKEEYSIWKNKNIAWYGTSIPAGSNFSIPIKGNAIDAYITSYKVAKTEFTKDSNLPCEYPVITASLLGAKEVHNESQGSSRIVRNTTDERLLIRCKGLTNSVQEICSYIWGSYNIDIANQTFEENHENMIGITTFLTTAGTWSSFVNNVCLCLRQSYQICLTLRHLISNSTQRSTYITNAFGGYLSDVTLMLESVGYTMDDLCGYHDIDLFVLEHSVNDSYNFMRDVPVDSNDINTFQGAYNKIIGEILRYKPSVRIVIVSNYGKTGSEETYNQDKVQYLKAIAGRWQLPIIVMSEFTNVQWVPQLTQGYWDANYYWHDSGFTWVEDVGNDSFTTNATFNDALYNSSLAVMKTLIHPQQIDGVWYWEAPSIYLWMFDALHPHSDKGGRLAMFIGKVLAKQLNLIGIV